MRLRLSWCLVVGLAAVAGCSRQQTAPCEPEPRYATARSAPPVQIPDDLSPPDENDAIRLPPIVGVGASITAGECLEAPPPFFGDSRPFVSSEESTEGQSRRERREAKREARRGETPASQPDAPAEPREPAPAEPAPAEDRVIDN